MPPTFLFVLILVLAVAVLYWMILKNSAAKIARQFAVLAEAYGLELNEPAPAMGGFIRPEPSLYGWIQEREVSISVPGKGLQNTRQIETVLKLQVKDNRFAAQMTKAGLLSGLRQRDSGGMERWKSEDAAFDAAVDARSNDARRMASLIDDSLQVSLRELLKKGKGSIYIGGGMIAYAEMGLIANDAVRERFESVLKLFLALAREIESGGFN
ncbi:MAG: hypothetical protein ACNA77_06010 [Opitutales bacterium]